MKKRIICALLFLLLALSGAALAQESQPSVISTGISGNIAWSLDSEGCLTISGTGAVPDGVWRTAPAAYAGYDHWLETPWSAYTGQIRRVVIEEGVTRLGTYAFYRCAGLQEIRFPSTLRIIGASALSGTGLSELALSEGLEEIGEDAFSFNASLTSVSVPGSLVMIGKGAFSECPEIESVSFEGDGSPADWARIHFADVEANPLSVSGKALLYHHSKPVTRLNLSDDAEPVSAYALYGCQNEITVTSNGQYPGPVGAYAFYGCSNLTAVQLSPVIASIGDYAFFGCERLADLGQTLEGPRSIGASAFAGCTSLTSVSLGGSLTYAGSDVFMGCAALSSLTIGEGTSVLFDRMFSGCESLQDVTIPRSVISIGAYAFENCFSLSHITFRGRAPSFAHLPFAGVDADVTYFEGPSWEGKTEQYGGQLRWAGVHGASADGNLTWTLDEDGLLSFSGMGEISSTGSWYNYQENILNIALGEGITGFSYNLLSVYLPRDGSISFYGKMARTVGKVDGVTPQSLAGHYTFTVWEDWAPDAFWSMDREGLLTVGGTGPMPDYDRKSSPAPWYAVREQVKALRILPGVTRIGRQAFSGLDHLSGEATIPGTCAEIGEEAFLECTHLEVLTLESGVTQAGARAFSHMDHLTQAALPDTLTALSEEAFASCKSLASIVLPDSLLSLPDRCFASCAALAELSLPRGLTAIGRECFDGCKQLSQIELPGTLTQIGDFLFRGCDALTALTLPEGITALPRSPFWDSLTDIYLPSALVQVDEEAFATTHNQLSRPLSAVLHAPFGSPTALLIDREYTDDRWPAFSFRGLAPVLRDDSLTSYELPEGVTQLPDGLFAACTQMRSVTLPASLTAIGENVFPDTLEEIIAPAGSWAAQWADENGVAFTALQETGMN